MRSWTQGRLASEVSALGVKIDQSAIARIESEKRSVSLEEALALAVALGVQPAALVAPADSMMLEVVPNAQRWAASENVWEWFAGRYAIGPLPPTYESIDDAITEFAEHERATNRFYYQSVSDIEEESIRLLPRIHDLFLEAGYLKGTARALVRQQKDRRGILPLLHGQLEELQTSVSAALENVERIMRDKELDSVPPPRRSLRHPSHRNEGN
jgi:hypothetical protein